MKDYTGYVVESVVIDDNSPYEPTQLRIRFTDQSELVVRAASMAYDQFGRTECLAFEEWPTDRERFGARNA